jgi:hypothetical protein
LIHELLSFSILFTIKINLELFNAFCYQSSITVSFKDIIYGGIEIGKAYLRTVDKPVPKAGQVVIENLAIAQNPVDVAQFIEFKLSSKF